MPKAPFCSCVAQWLFGTMDTMQQQHGSSDSSVWGVGTFMSVGVRGTARASVRCALAIVGLALIGGGSFAGCSGDEAEAPDAMVQTEPDAAVPDAGPPRFRALVFTKTHGYRHASIEDGLAMLQDMARAEHFAIDATEDAAMISDEALEPYEVLVFLNTRGNILDDAQKAALQAFVAKGRGFVGVHCASATHQRWDWYQDDLIGARFVSHSDSPDTPGTVVVDEGALDHPAARGLPASWDRIEEWYAFDHDVTGLPGVQVLLRLASEGNRPLAWTREVDGHRMFYTALGHAEAAYMEEPFQRHVLGGLLWAARQ